MEHDLSGKRVAILLTDGFEQVEMTRPREALESAGARTDLICPESGTVRAWDRKDWGEEFEVGVALDNANPDDYDALLLPGGVMNPDRLRMNPRAVQFARSFFDAGKPVAAICHGPWLLVEADVVRGRRVTSYPSLRTDLENAGAEWVDEPVVVDSGMVTSRNPDDLPAFNEKLLEEVSEGVHAGQSA